MGKHRDACEKGMTEEHANQGGLTISDNKL